MQREQARAPIGFLITGGIAIALAVVTLWSIFVAAPIEAQMGIAQKIFYFHVPSAYSMYIGFVLAGLGSIGYLVWRNDKADALAVAGAEVGLLFCVAVLITGPLWARKAWGVYWAWDPRLTSTLLAGLIFMAFVVLRSFGGAGGEGERRFAAALAILGIGLIPIIHYSVELWNGQHPTVVGRRGGGLADPNMRLAFALGMVFFTFLTGLLIAARYRAERAKQRLDALEMEAAANGLLEEA